MRDPNWPENALRDGHLRRHPFFQPPPEPLLRPQATPIQGASRVQAGIHSCLALLRRNRLQRKRLEYQGFGTASVSQIPVHIPARLPRPARSVELTGCRNEASRVQAGPLSARLRRSCFGTGQHKGKGLRTRPRACQTPPRPCPPFRLSLPETREESPRQGFMPLAPLPRPCLIMAANRRGRRSGEGGFTP